MKSLVYETSVPSVEDLIVRIPATNGRYVACHESSRTLQLQHWRPRIPVSFNVVSVPTTHAASLSVWKLESWRIEHEPDDHAVEMKAIASEAASGTSSAREAARRLGLPPSSVHNILRQILQLYPYKLQSCNGLLPADTAQREAFAKWAFSKMEQDPTWVFNILWTDEALFSLHGDVNNHNCRIWAISNPREYTQKPLHSPKVTA
ncbi:uncharacterized protein TNCV_2768801 [Trichonephila clavipes]|nr:uncharacterized protein TNCV_2768801 [Trichonephila clavipes]